MKFIYVNCSWRNEYGSDPCSYEHYLSNNENKVWKNSGLYGSSSMNFHYYSTARIAFILICLFIQYHADKWWE